MRTGQFSLIVLFAVVFPFISGCDFLDSIFKRNQVEVPKAVVPKIDVMKPQMRKVTDYEEFTGETAAVDEVEIKAQVSGYLSRVAFTEGSEVKKGDLLFEIEPEVYKAVRDSAKAELDSLTAKLPRLENEVTRYLELLQTKAVSQSDSEGAVSDRDECRAKTEKAKAELQRAEIDLKYTKIISPIDGFISRKLISEGNLVQTHSSSNSSL
ncbi:MAG: efflux RND transporter periplasmic adaptor subunit, partial [Thermoguttaceae bacterium]|nr:efflux RND transporter periplasmic adaptor subunit [Thermoguttaceae bacterium]